MPSWVQSDPLRGRPKRAWVFDGAMALGALAVGSVTVGVARTAVDYAYPSTSAAWTVVLVMVVPLVFRRVWPLPIHIFVFVVAAAVGWWAVHLFWCLALLITLYTVAARCPRRVALACAGTLGLAVVASPVIAFDFSDSSVQLVIFLLVAVAAVLVLGLYVATRRTLLLELHDRAARLERERDQQGEIAAGAERARIARELHDIVAHHLTVMVALADGAAAQSRRSPEDAHDAMRTVSATGRQALADTRRLLGVLRDHDTDAQARSPLPDLGDLDELITGVRAAGLSVRYRVSGELPELDQGTQLALYRMVQEALTNTMKHAGPDATATVTVRTVDGRLELDVVDDGTHVAATPGVGRGLPGMRERMAVVGGEVTSGPADGRGWAVRVRLPLQRAKTVDAR